MKKKGLALAAASALLVLGVVAGSLAWLTDKTEAVTNVFTTSDINVELKETTTDYKMIPGWDISKDPKATVKTGSEDCYLFVKIEKSTNYGTYLEDYTIADGWTALEGNEGVFYKVFDSKDSANTNAMGTPYSILKDDKVTVKGSVTKSDMEKIDGLDKDGEEDSTEVDARPTLTFTAYASQLYKTAETKFTAIEAWNNISNPTGATTP